MLVEAISRTLAPAGLCLRGGFRPQPEDGVPPLADGRPAKAVLLVGNVGPAMWQRFRKVRPTGPDPMDDWTASVLHPVAGRFNAVAVFPFQLPFLPFQRWATRADTVHVSPLGILVHPLYGLWHALRGALLLADDPALPEPPHGSSPCGTCTGRPCLHACPVQAFSGSGYDVSRCVTRLSAAAGEDCMARGCRARHACPLGAGYRYGPAQARFHMEGFLDRFHSPS